MGNLINRVEREKEFHNAPPSFSRRLLDRMAASFYSKQQFWGKLWEEWPLSGKIVLDYGCGCGDFSVELAKRNAIVHSIDVSERLIRIARRSVPPSVRSPEFYVCDAQSTSFPDNTFDFVFGNAILHHLDLNKAYAEISRVLKPGSRAAFAEPLDRHPLISLVRLTTPRARSADERPLSFQDIDQASRYFSKVWHDEHFLLAVAAAPLHLISRKIAERTLKFLNSVDRAIFESVSMCRSYAWYTLIHLQKANDHGHEYSGSSNGGKARISLTA